jgi:hypothetical protein
MLRLVLCLTLLLPGCSSRSSRTARPPQAQAAAEPVTAPPEVREDARWLGIAGGAEPSSTQVSIEQDMVLLRDVMGPTGAVLFAGGSTVPSVQVLEPAPAQLPLRERLGEFFDPRPGRRARYRKPAIPIDGPATTTATQQVLERLLERPGAQLLVYIAGHGVAGQRPVENVVHLWGGWPLEVPALAELLDGAQRPVRLVMTTCHSGGFAELAFAGADAKASRPAAGDHCGLFATSWDQEASGCDPNPDRAAQEGYGLHFLNALRSRGRDGVAQPRSRFDLDGDGRISLLEAHTRARIASRSIDRPTTTSERWLRHAAGADEPDAGVPPELEPPPAQSFQQRLPEEHAVVTQLGPALGLRDAGAARARMNELDTALRDLDEALRDLEADRDDAYAALRIALLERWPVLDDPWHPQFPAVLAGHGDAIARVLEQSPAASNYRRLQQQTDSQSQRYDDLRVQHAVTSRLWAAWETAALAAQLERRGGSAWQHYQKLLGCERSVP